jgi:hypothetical protein
MEKDRATEYWGNEIKRAAENTAKARAEYKEARKEEERAYNRHVDVEENMVSEETREYTLEIYRQRSLLRSQKWDAYLMASKWEGITRGAAESYKKWKAAKEANKQESTQSRGRRQ